MNNRIKFVDTINREEIDLSVKPVHNYLSLITELDGRTEHNIKEGMRLNFSNDRLNLLIANGMNRNSSLPHSEALAACKNFTKVAEVLANKSYDIYNNGNLYQSDDSDAVAVLGTMIGLVTMANAILGISSNILTGNESGKINDALDEMILDIAVYKECIDKFKTTENLVRLNNADSGLCNLDNIGAIQNVFGNLREMFLGSNNPVFLKKYTEENSLVKKLVEQVLEPAYYVFNAIHKVL